TVASAVSGGILGAINAVSGVVSAVFEGLQFFQGRRMEQDIGRIEVTSRGILNQTISLQNTFNQWLPFLNNLAFLPVVASNTQKMFEGLAAINFNGSGLAAQISFDKVDLGDQVSQLNQLQQAVRDSAASLSTNISVVNQKQKSFADGLLNLGGVLGLLTG